MLRSVGNEEAMRERINDLIETAKDTIAVLIISIALIGIGGVVYSFYRDLPDSAVAALGALITMALLYLAVNWALTRLGRMKR
jgi:ABC-type amino acid transport system permease subunit